MSVDERDLSALVDDSVLVEESTRRRRLLELAAAGPEERVRAMLLDPGLAAAGGADGDFSDTDVTEVKLAVLAARRLQDVDWRSQRAISHRLSGLVTVLALLLVFLLPAEVDRSVGSALGVSAPGIAVQETVLTHPTVEAIAPAGARVYELADEEFSVVWFVDESFEL